jgi:hypothetical protein
MGHTVADGQPVANPAKIGMWMPEPPVDNHATMAPPWYGRSILAWVRSTNRYEQAVSNLY